MEVQDRTTLDLLSRYSLGDQQLVITSDNLGMQHLVMQPHIDPRYR
jgi:hypothetical protein